MTPELDQALVAKYPKIFRDRCGDMRLTAMCWGFEHGDGWFSLLEGACALIQHHVDESRTHRARALRFNRALARAKAGDLASLMRYWQYDDLPLEDFRAEAQASLSRGVFQEVPAACSQVVATQVKEKFGTLRFYVAGGDDYVRGIIDLAEYLSGTVCETCGKPGSVNESGWLACRCEACRARRQQF
jgi:hypothetical protein